MKHAPLCIFEGNHEGRCWVINKGWVDPQATPPLCGHRFLSRGSEKLGIPDKYLDPPCSLAKGHDGNHGHENQTWGANDTTTVNKTIFTCRPEEIVKNLEAARMWCFNKRNNENSRDLGEAIRILQCDAPAALYTVVAAARNESPETLEAFKKRVLEALSYEKQLDLRAYMLRQELAKELAKELENKPRPVPRNITISGDCIDTSHERCRYPDCRCTCHQVLSNGPVRP